MVNTVKFSQFPLAINSNPGTQFAGLSAGANIIKNITVTWTTATRPTPPFNGALGYNTDISEYEFYNSVTASWVQIASGGVGVTLLLTGTGLTGGPITSTGTVSFAPIAANSLWANITGASAVPTVVPLSDFLLSANNLSDLTNIPQARINLGLQIGVNVEAWNHQLDLIAAGVWPGAASITTVGTITSGNWNGTTISVPFGGTGNTSFTPFAVLCAGVTATSAFQNVASVGLVGQILTSNGPGVLPTWQNTSGSGTVISGSINQLAWYAATGSSVSGLATAPNGVLVTSNSSVPSISSTLPVAVQGNITQVGTVISGTWNGSVIGMAFGGTGANISPVANNLVYSTGSNLTLLATGNNGVLVTSAGGVPSISSTLPNAVQANITQVGIISSGTWNGGTITVPFGGTSLVSFATYAVVCGGTTTTGALQQVSGLGAIGQVLTSQGAGALPQWANATGTGTVNSGGINDLAYYAAPGNVISGLATANNGVLVTSAGGVPSISASLPGAVQLNITSLGTITAGIWNGTTIDVADGGTGDTSFIAYSVICAGTTSTGNLQNVSGVGLSGQVLTSQGPGSLPQWANATGTGTVNSGAQNDIAYYAANGSTISALATAAGGVLVTSNSGVPSILAGSGSTGTVLQAVAGGTPAWSNATYPTITTINELLYSSANNVVSGLATSTTAVLTTVAGVPTWAAQLSLSRGGTNANLTADDGAIVYSTASALALLAHTTTAGLALLSGNNAAPTWSTNPPITGINIQRITATGAFTYTKTAGTVAAIFEFVGGGGGSGGTTGAGAQQACAGGGGAGSYLKILVTGAANLNAITGSVGVGGLAGLSGNNPGGAGGNTTLTINGGTTWVAAGGVLGAGATAQTAPIGGRVPTGIATNTIGTNATLIENITGAYASTGFSNGASFQGCPSNGGNSKLGSGGVGSDNGVGPGGGAGGTNNFSGANAGGNTGAIGIVIITEFISA